MHAAPPWASGPRTVISAHRPLFPDGTGAPRPAAGPVRSTMAVMEWVMKYWANYSYPSKISDKF
jgi:hypothetical protein